MQIKRNFAHSAVRFLAKEVLKILYRLYLLFRVPLFLFLNRELFKNQIIFLDTDFSFGYQIYDLEFLQRMYYPVRISKVEVIASRKNGHISKCYEEQIDNFPFETSCLPASLVFQWPLSSIYLHVVQQMFEFYLQLFGLFGKKRQIFGPRQFYNILGQAGRNQMKMYDASKQTIVDHYDHTGFLTVLASSKCPPTKLPKKYSGDIDEKISKLHAKNGTTKIATLLLRKARTEEYYDRMRGIQFQENYRLAVKWLASQGYLIIGTGETDGRIFSDIKEFCNAETLNVDYQLLNLFALTRTDLFISQHSGAYILANCADVPVLLTDSFPFYLGTLVSSDVILLKKYKFKGKLILPEEILIDHLPIVYGQVNEAAGYEIVDNTPEEILDAVKKSNVRKLNFPSDTSGHYLNNFYSQT